MARPARKKREKKDASQTLSKRIALRVSFEEYTQLTLVAKRRKDNLSAVLRSGMFHEFKVALEEAEQRRRIKNEESSRRSKESYEKRRAEAVGE